MIRYHKMPSIPVGVSEFPSPSPSPLNAITPLYFFDIVIVCVVFGLFINIVMCFSFGLILSVLFRLQFIICFINCVCSISFASPSSWPPYLIAGYYQRFFQENQKIGSGGFGSVFHCTHMLDSVQLGTYAVKKIPVGDNRPWLLRVLRWVQLAASLHPIHHFPTGIICTISP